MPLEDHVPLIDNRRYDDIMSEVRTRIARYTPEWTPVWTDVNNNDPGITMVQVFAWLTEMTIYRLGQVPELNYLKFLDLMGIELRPALPARVEITLPILNSHPEPYVIVPPRTQVAAEADDGTELIVFETERAAIALKARLAEVLVFDGYDYKPFTDQNVGTSSGFDPFGPLAREGSALTLGFAFDGVFPAAVRLDLAIWTMQPGVGNTAYECGLTETPFFPSTHLIWEFWAGREWRNLNLLKDETRALGRSGHVLFETPAKDEMRQETIGGVIEPLYWIRARLTRSSNELPPRLLAVRNNTITAIQAETVRDEVLGGSDGSPNQTFRLNRSPVINDSLQLEIDEGLIPDAGMTLAWSQKDDFFGSSADDRHYVLIPTTGEVSLGDGFNGSIPVANVDNPGGNVVAREYRTGGGTQGNISSGRLTTLLTSVDGIDETAVTNLFAAYGGRNEETLEQAKKRAQQSLKSRCRAVTGEDFEQLAGEAANVQRARALPLYHPKFPDVPVPGVVTVIIVPDVDTPNPMPDEGTLRTVCAYLNQRRLLTTEVYVVPPIYREVSVNVDVSAEDNADLGEVKEATERALLEYFHPLHGGENKQGWPFGGDIFFSLVYRCILDVPGVLRLEPPIFSLDGQPMPECQDVPIAEGELLFSTSHDINIHYALGT